ncbi:MAG: CoA transferase [Pseudomonadales bacterium]|jgi:crotonobetainyl-CoA:carnitine CoA-transferase CaiB-like acyl-CoA transferase|nr:CoA transferase [Pseudomonadales bacterium]
MESIEAALGLDRGAEVVGEARFPSCFAVSDLAAAAVGAVGASVAALVSELGLAPQAPAVRVDQRLASLWCLQSIVPIGWSLPPVWDAVAGDYTAQNDWIRLHTNLPRHRAAALAVLGVTAERARVAEAVARWDADALEQDIIAAGGVAARMRSVEAWAAHPQGRAVGDEPLITWGSSPVRRPRAWPATLEQPLNGLRVLDLTRVLAGPVATRTLAGFGAQVLRIDPPGWEEANLVPDITLGKHCACLRLDDAKDRACFEALLSEADLLVHGYRPDALDRLGYGAATRARLAPALLEVTLDAYGWTGPWATRRGFDSLVQMSSGIADAGRRWAGADCPTPLPVQALDHATGYLMAAAILRALAGALSTAGGRHARLSLARTAALLVSMPQDAEAHLERSIPLEDCDDAIEVTPWGPARRLRPPLHIDGVPMRWSRPACTLGSAPAAWPGVHPPS